MKNINKYILLLLFSFVFTACDNTEDYSERKFLNYLGYEIEQANLKLSETIEGIEEGEYNVGAQSLYLNSISASTNVYNSSDSSQEDIDVAYQEIIAAGVSYFDEMVPYTSWLIKRLEEANFLYSATVEGVEDGNVLVGSKEPFLTAINHAQDFFDAGGYTQSELDSTLSTLISAIFAYEANLIGAFNVPIENASFEEPGVAIILQDKRNGESDPIVIYNFPGWVYAGDRFDWSIWWSDQARIAETGTLELPVTSDGDFAINIGNYTHGIWQELGEGVHSGATYTLSFDASIVSSPGDWLVGEVDTFVLSRVIVFSGDIGDLSNITVIDQQSNNLGAATSTNDFTSFSHTIEIPQDSSFQGENMVIQFKIYEAGFNFEQNFWPAVDDSEIWSQTWVLLDKVVLKRE